MQLTSEFEEDGRSCFLDMPALIRKRVGQARVLRERLGLPGAGTDVYRCEGQVWSEKGCSHYDVTWGMRS